MSRSILGQISEIQGLSLADLRERWRILYGTDAPGYSREHLIRRLAYRTQELAHGCLQDATRATLSAVAEQDGTGGQARPLSRRGANQGGPVAGTRLIREWGGERHEVTVVDGGFEYQGRLFRSLTAVAKAITGQHWNGRLFFGLRDRKRSR
jgi:hypothetical protein